VLEQDLNLGFGRDWWVVRCLGGWDDLNTAVLFLDNSWHVNQNLDESCLQRVWRYIEIDAISVPLGQRLHRFYQLRRLISLDEYRNLVVEVPGFEDPAIW